MTKHEITIAREAGRWKTLERRKRRVLFHVACVNRAIRRINLETSFATPMPHHHLDEWAGLFAWNDWFFNEFRTKKELELDRN